MTARFVTQVPQIVAGVDWSRFATLVDVGGGHGTLLAAVLEAHPAMTARLVDLERTATAAAQTFQQRGLHERATAIAGSFFDPLPPRADAYLLCDILYDWDDQHAQQILARCADAARPDSRILVIEAVGDRHTHPAHDLAMRRALPARQRRPRHRPRTGNHRSAARTPRPDASPRRRPGSTSLTAPPAAAWATRAPAFPEHDIGRPVPSDVMNRRASDGKPIAEPAT